MKNIILNKLQSEDFRIVYYNPLLENKDNKGNRPIDFSEQLKENKANIDISQNINEVKVIIVAKGFNKYHISVYENTFISADFNQQYYFSIEGKTIPNNVLGYSMQTNLSDAVDLLIKLVK